MEYLAVIVAAAGSYAFGALWYMTLAKPWMKATGITPEQVEGGAGKDPMPFIISAIAAILVAGMMRHVFTQAGIIGAYKGGLSGLGIGLFLVTPWIMTNYAYGMRPRNLTLIDGGYATIGCTIIGVILGLFAA
ncbi:MAG: DUF1761 domain-containing protein [Paracoccaceae bacterium]